MANFAAQCGYCTPGMLMAAKALLAANPNPTRQDVVDTLEMLYELRRPFTLNTFSLRVIPNSRLEREIRESGVDLAGTGVDIALAPSGFECGTDLGQAQPGALFRRRR